jgi:hypothetical protein
MIYLSKLGALYLWTHTHSVMKRSKMMVKQEAHYSKDSLMRSEEDPCKEVVDDEEEGVVSLPSVSSSAVHAKEQHQSVSCY